MSGIHILVVPEHETFRRDDGERWCFVCRRRVRFVFRVTTPDDPMSYYGPRAEIRCENDHLDGDCFPGTGREWEA